MIRLTNAFSTDQNRYDIFINPKHIIQLVEGIDRIGDTAIKTTMIYTEKLPPVRVKESAAEIAALIEVGK